MLYKIIAGGDTVIFNFQLSIFHLKRLRPGDPAVVWLRVYQNDVRADLFDAVPGNDVVVPAARNAQQTAGAGDHDGADIAVRDLNLDISDESQPLPRAGADDLLALQVSEFHGQGAFPLLERVCAGGGR